MRNLMLGLSQLKPEIFRMRESRLRGARGKDETGTGKSELLILVSRITKAQSKEEAREDVKKSSPISLVKRKPKTTDRMGQGHAARGLFMRALVMRIRKKIGLIDRGMIKIGLTMVSLGTAVKRQR